MQVLKDNCTGSIPAAWEAAPHMHVHTAKMWFSMEGIHTVYKSTQRSRSWEVCFIMSIISGGCLPGFDVRRPGQCWNR